MKNLQIFDPAMCCSTGVCGADVDWLRKQGVTVERFNLARQVKESPARAYIDPAHRQLDQNPLRSTIGLATRGTP